MKKFLLALFALSCMALGASPVKSMLAANESELIVASSPLPDGIVAVEYIESTGTQYIDTGIIPTASTGIACEFQVMQYNDGSFGIFRNNPYRFLYVNFFNNKIYFRYGGTQYSGISDGLNVKGRNYIVMSDGKCVLNGIVVVEGAEISRLDGSIDPFIMFALIKNGTVSGFTKMRCFGFQMFNGDEMLLDMIPVRALVDNEWVGAMYDLVSGELYFNNGTGAFLIGPDKEK